MKTSDKNRAILAEVIARAWRQPEYRAELKSGPKKTLKDAGMDIPPDTDVVVLENTPSTLYAVLPPLGDQLNYQSRLEKATKRIAELPENLELRVVRDTPHKAHIIIPAVPAAVAIGQLSDAALEQVAGGKSSANTNTNSEAEAETTAVEVQTAATTTTVAAEVEVVVVPCFIS
jgi:nitrile hydratase alpha subunit